MRDFWKHFKIQRVRLINLVISLSSLTHGAYDLESNSIVVYLRMLTSAQIRLDPENFAPFLFHPELGEPMEIREFCEHFVDATGKEAGMPKAVL